MIFDFFAVIGPVDTDDHFHGLQRLSGGKRQWDALIGRAKNDSDPGKMFGDAFGIRSTKHT